MDNPLRQYFRRPAIYLRLPSGGKQYDETILTPTETGELPVYPMTAIDDITTKTPDALFNGTTVTELIKSCIPNIIDPWRIHATDIDAILIAIKSASSGDEVEIESECPACEETSTYGISLAGLLTSLKANDYNKTLQIGDLTFKFRPLTYKEMNDASQIQFEMQRSFRDIDNMTDEEEQKTASDIALKNITSVTIQILSRTIEHIQTPTIKIDEQEYIMDYLQNCDKNVFGTIRDYNTKLKEESELKPLDFTCASCKHEYKQVFHMNQSDFFG